MTGAGGGRTVAIAPSAGTRLRSFFPPQDPRISNAYRPQMDGVCRLAAPDVVIFLNFTISCNIFLRMLHDFLIFKKFTTWRPFSAENPMPDRHNVVDFRGQQKNIQHFGGGNIIANISMTRHTRSCWLNLNGQEKKPTRSVGSCRTMSILSGMLAFCSPQ